MTLPFLSRIGRPARRAKIAAYGLGLILSASSLIGQSEGYRPAIKVALLLQTEKTESGQPIAFPQVNDPEVRALMVEIPPGAETGWHVHPFPCYAYILSGSLQVEFDGGEKKELKAGQAFAEAVNVLHNGKNLGTEPVKLILFVTGEKGLPFTIPRK